MRYERCLDLKQLLSEKSFFLFGPRSTGKTYLINQQLVNEALIIDLLNTEIYLRLSASPVDLEGIIKAGHPRKKIVVIDEIQKIPELLSEVHRLLETTDVCFLLTGSSARKLRKSGVDMLAGRAWKANLFPLCSKEIPDFDLERYLRYGGLPQVCQSRSPDEELYSYVDIYLKEEIRAEGIIRRLPPFSRFLKTAALSSGTLLNFAQIASDCAVPVSTVREYYSILEDTLIGFALEPWIHSRKRKAIQTAKFYLFDTGVTHTIAGTKILERNSNIYGQSFEQFIAMELRAYLSYRRIKDPMTFWRSTHGFEVDFLIGEHTAIETKATKRASPRDMKGLKTLKDEGIFKKFYFVSQDNIATEQHGIFFIHWREFLERLWNDDILK